MRLSCVLAAVASCPCAIGAIRIVLARLEVGIVDAKERVRARRSGYAGVAIGILRGVRGVRAAVVLLTGAGGEEVGAGGSGAGLVGLVLEVGEAGLVVEQLGAEVG